MRGVSEPSVTWDEESVTVVASDDSSVIVSFFDAGRNPAGTVFTSAGETKVFPLRGEFLAVTLVADMMVTK